MRLAIEVVLFVSYRSFSININSPIYGKPRLDHLYPYTSLLTYSFNLKPYTCIPVFKSLSEFDQLRFEIAELTREVVTDGRRSYFCEAIHLLGFACNWRPCEVLTYTISYHEQDDELLLKIEIDGRLGSGVYANACRRSYISLSVEHYPQLEAYADQMRRRIYRWLHALNYCRKQDLQD